MKYHAYLSSQEGYLNYDYDRCLGRYEFSSVNDLVHFSQRLLALTDISGFYFAAQIPTMDEIGFSDYQILRDGMIHQWSNCD